MNFIFDNYTYSKYINDITEFKNFDCFNCFSIGKSVLGKDIYVIKIGDGKKHVFYNGAHHALEWITTSVLMKFCYDILLSQKTKKRFLGCDIVSLLNDVTFHILPRLNPDGVDLVLYNGINDTKLMNFLVKANGSCDFSKRWQSNINGVDLNHNYDAGFENSTLLYPAHTKYQGPYPESEPEVKAICEYVRKNDFDLSIALHTQGEVIYYDYDNFVPENGYEIGKIFSKSSGYMLDTPEGSASYGGFKDWFIKTYKKPCYTLELGKGKNPLPFSQFNLIYDKVKEILLAGAYLI